METKTYGMFLPHRWQKIGYWMLAISILCVVLNALLDGANDSGLINLGGDTNGWLGNLFAIVPLFMHISLFLICLSDEKQENESVMHIRIGIIKKIILFWFIASFLCIFLGSMNFSFGMTESPNLLFTFINFTTNSYVLILAYIAWLKHKTNKLRKKK